MSKPELNDILWFIVVLSFYLLIFYDSTICFTLLLLILWIIFSNINAKKINVKYINSDNVSYVKCVGPRKECEIFFLHVQCQLRINRLKKEEEKKNSFRLFNHNS